MSGYVMLNYIYLGTQNTSGGTTGGEEQWIILWITLFGEVEKYPKADKETSFQWDLHKRCPVW